MQWLVSAFLIVRLDYCKSVLVGLFVSVAAPLQHVLSAAVHLVAGLGPHDQVTEHIKRMQPTNYLQD